MWAIIILSVMIILLFMGYPMVVPLIATSLLGVFLFIGGSYFFVGDFSQSHIIMSKFIEGVSPVSLIAVPLFIFAADIMTRGSSAQRLITLVMALQGHKKGGVAITTASVCALFGAVSGSTQATVVAIGKPLLPVLEQNGYSERFSLPLITSASGIALLIPPSIGMIIYASVAKTSIADLFIAGILPGILVLVLFSAYSVFHAYGHNIPTMEKATSKEVGYALMRAFLPLGFPAIIIIGIYGGFFSPLEAAAICVLYAFIVEFFIYRSISLGDIMDIAKTTGLVTAVVFVLVGAGAVFSWMIAYESIPELVLSYFGFGDSIGDIKALSDSQIAAKQTSLLIAICIAFFLGCMFVDSIVVILIFVPIFLPDINALGLDKVLIGVLITMQVAIGAVTPPFGCNIFTAVAIFRKPYYAVVRGSFPFIVLFVLAAALLIKFPDIALYLIRDDVHITRFFLYVLGVYLIMRLMIFCWNYICKKQGVGQ